MMLQALSILCLLALCQSYPSSTNDIKSEEFDIVLAEIFGTKPTEDNKGTESIRLKREADVECTQEIGKKGKCVPYYLCDPKQQDSITGAGLIDIRGPEDEGCTWDVGVCCELEHIMTLEMAKKPA